MAGGGASAHGHMSAQAHPGSHQSQAPPIGPHHVVLDPVIVQSLNFCMIPIFITFLDYEYEFILVIFSVCDIVV